MKIAFVVNVDLEAMKLEDSLQGWQQYLQDELGADPELFAKEDEKAWEQVACEIGMHYFAGGDNDTFVTFVETEVENDQEIVEDHRKQGL